MRKALVLVALCAVLVVGGYVAADALMRNGGNQAQDEATVTTFTDADGTTHVMTCSGEAPGDGKTYTSSCKVNPPLLVATTP